MSQVHPDDLADAIGVVEAAELIGVSDQTIRNWIGKGLLRVVIQLPGGVKRISRTELLKLVAPNDQDRSHGIGECSEAETAAAIAVHPVTTAGSDLPPDAA